MFLLGLPLGDPERYEGPPQGGLRNTTSILRPSLETPLFWSEIEGRERKDFMKVR